MAGSRNRGMTTFDQRVRVCEGIDGSSVARGLPATRYACGMAQLTVFVMAGVAVLIGIAAVVMLWQILALVSRRTPTGTDDSDRS